MIILYCQGAKQKRTGMHKRRGRLGKLERKRDIKRLFSTIRLWNSSIDFGFCEGTRGIVRARNSWIEQVGRRVVLGCWINVERGNELGPVRLRTRIHPGDEDFVARTRLCVWLKSNCILRGGLTGVARSLRATWAYLASPFVKYDFHVEDRPELLENRKQSLENSLECV